MSGNGELKNVPTIKALFAATFRNRLSRERLPYIPLFFGRPTKTQTSWARRPLAMSGSCRELRAELCKRGERLLFWASRCELYEPMQRLDKHDISNYFIIVPQTELPSRACERLENVWAGRLAPDDASGGGFKKDMATPVTEYLFFPFRTASSTLLAWSSSSRSSRQKRRPQGYDSGVFPIRILLFRVYVR